MERDNIIINLNDLAIGYKSKASTKIVASGINTSIKKGELTALLGSNGIGKSTLLRTLTKNQKALSGRVEIQGRCLSSYKAAELSKLISIVLTERIELKNTSVFEVVAMGRAPYTNYWGALSSHDKAIVDEVLALVKIEGMRNRFVDTLSDGERQKVMIAKALAQQTPIIFLDEPTAFLDFPSKVDIMQILHKLTRDLHKTVLLSTHDLDLALQISDRVWLMDGKSKLHVGVPEDLSLDGTLSKFFERKGIIFDKNSGLFKIENTLTRKIRMVGHGHRYAMIRKAMLRNGIQASSLVESQDSNFDFMIEVNKERITLTYNDNRHYEIYKIEDLLRHI